MKNKLIIRLIVLLLVFTIPVQAIIDDKSEVINKLKIDEQGNIIEGTVSFSNQQTEIGDIVAENLNAEDIKVSNIILDKKYGVTTLTFKEGGQFDINIKDPITEETNTLNFENIKEGGIIKLDEKGNIIEADITSASEKSYTTFTFIEGTDPSDTQKFMVNVPENTRVIFSGGDGVGSPGFVDIYKGEGTNDISYVLDDKLEGKIDMNGENLEKVRIQYDKIGDTKVYRIDSVGGGSVLSITSILGGDGKQEIKIDTGKHFKEGIRTGGSEELEHGHSIVKTNKQGQIEDIKLSNSEVKIHSNMGEIHAHQGSRDEFNLRSIDDIEVGHHGSAEDIEELGRFFETGTGTKVNVGFNLDEKLGPSLEVTSIFGLDSSININEGSHITNIGSDSNEGVNVFKAKASLGFPFGEERHNKIDSLSEFGEGDPGLHGNSESLFNTLLEGFEGLEGGEQGGHQDEHLEGFERLVPTLDLSSNFRSIRRYGNSIIVPTEISLGASCNPLTGELGCKAEIIKRIYNPDGEIKAQYFIGYSGRENFEENVVGVGIGIFF